MVTRKSLLRKKEGTAKNAGGRTGPSKLQTGGETGTTDFDGGGGGIPSKRGTGRGKKPEGTARDLTLCSAWARRPGARSPPEKSNEQIASRERRENQKKKKGGRQGRESSPIEQTEPGSEATGKAQRRGRPLQRKRGKDRGPELDRRRSGPREI